MNTDGISVAWWLQIPDARLHRRLAREPGTSRRVFQSRSEVRRGVAPPASERSAALRFYRMTGVRPRGAHDQVRGILPSLRKCDGFISGTIQPHARATQGVHHFLLDRVRNAASDRTGRGSAAGEKQVSQPRVPSNSLSPSKKSQPHSESDKSASTRSSSSTALPSSNPPTPSLRKCPAQGHLLPQC